MKEDNALTTQRPTDWVDTVVQAATIANQLFSKNSCRLCQVYADKQVEFETSTEQRSSSPMERLWMRTAQESSTLEVELYKNFLFDEDSVAEKTDRITTTAPDYLVQEHGYQRPLQIHHKEEDVVSTFTQRS